MEMAGATFDFCDSQLLAKAGGLGADASVGIVGLGVGTLACYRQPGQAWLLRRCPLWGRSA